MKKSFIAEPLSRNLRVNSSSTAILKCSEQDIFFAPKSMRRKRGGIEVCDQKMESLVQGRNPEKQEPEDNISLWKLPNSDAKTAITQQTTPEQKIAFKKRQNMKKMNVSGLHASKSLKREETVTNFFPPQRQRAPVQQMKKIRLEDFIILKKVGEGAYSQVFSAIEKKTNLVCALKKISKETVKKSNLIQVILREIKIHYRLRHKNILELYGIFDDEENIYLICEYCPNGDLFKMLRKKRKDCERMEVHEVAYILKQLCESIQLMHDEYLMHRDIKPDNIFLSIGNVVKLGDFGWSVYFGNQNMRNTQCGTPLYLAPELVGKQEYTHSVDIWAIGILAYELLTDENPFEIHTVQDLEKVISEEIYFEEIEDETARDFVERLLEKEASKRMEIEEVLQHEFLSFEEEKLSF